MTRNYNSGLNNEKMEEKDASTDQAPEKVDPLDAVSVPLLTRLSSERTLAVQAALLQQPQKAVALMVWTMIEIRS